MLPDRESAPGGSPRRWPVGRCLVLLALASGPFGTGCNRYSADEALIDATALPVYALITTRTGVPLRVAVTKSLPCAEGLKLTFEVENLSPDRIYGAILRIGWRSGGSRRWARVDLAGTLEPGRPVPVEAALAPFAPGDLAGLRLGVEANTTTAPGRFGPY